MTNSIFKQNHTPGRLQRDMLKRCGLALFFSAAVLLVTACGGGGGGSPATGSTANSNWDQLTWDKDNWK